MKTQIEIFRVVTPCSGVIGYHRRGDVTGGSMILRNVCILPQHYTASQSSSPRLDSWVI